MNASEIREKYCIDMTAVEARFIMAGRANGDKKKAEQELNRLYSDWMVHFKTNNGSKYTMKITGARNEKEAFAMAVKLAARNGNGDVIDKSAPLKVEYIKKW